MSPRLRNPYSFDQSRYFNWAMGIRATDRNHMVATEAMERLRAGAGEDRRAMFFASMPLIEESVELVRGKVALLLGCNARNVVFEASSTMVAILLHTAIRERLRDRKGVLVFSSMLQYPTILDPFFRPPDTTANMTTRQNMGLTILSSESVLQARIERARQRLESCGIAVPQLIPHYISDHFYSQVEWSKFGKRGPVTFHPFILSFASGHKWHEHPEEVDLIVIDQVSRFTGAAISQKSLANLYLNFKSAFPQSVFILDGSHGFGILDISLPDVCDVYLSNSSKGLAAEPTVGVAYMNDYVLALLQSSKAIDRNALRYAFSPEVGIAPTTNRLFRRGVPSTPLSYPELVSLEHAVDSFLTNPRDRHLSIRKTLWTMKERLLARVADLGRDDILPDNSSTVVGDRGNVLADSIGNPGYTTIFVGADAEKVAALLRSSGYAVTSLRKVYSILDYGGRYLAPAKDYDDDGPLRDSKDTDYRDFLSHRLRVSLRHDVEQDIQGFVDALVKAVDQVRSRSEQVRDQYSF